PYSEAELAWLSDRASGELDLVFLVDATGSMGPYIEQVKARLLELVAALRRMPLCRSLRLGLVTYRDHPPQDHTYASRTVPLTDEIAAIEAEVRKLEANGGGDGPESVTDGLFEVVRLKWRASAAKAVVWFGDAPPHGVEPGGDGFPQGCPCGNHWYTQAESCREMGIAIYAVGCLPGLRGYVGAEEVFRTVAKTTRGIYLPLGSASLLVPLIASAAATELDRRRIDAHVLERVRAHEALLREVDERERVRWLAELLRREGVRPREMKYDEGSPELLVPLRFRELEPSDVEGALDRLRGAGAIAV
ncbi:MAG TPA: vWA domain-containing protein, partial [Sandaracinaceae bacterium]